MSTHESLALAGPARTSDAGGSAAASRTLWRPRDVVLGIAVLLPLLHCSKYLGDWIRWVPGGTRYLLTAAIPLAWMTLYPQTLARLRGRPIRGGIPDLRHVARETVVALPVAFLMLVLLTGASYLYQRYTGTSLGSSSNKLTRGIPSGELLAYLLMSFTLIPIAEEFFFRGFVLQALRSKWIYGAIPAQAILFAVVHPYGLAERAMVFGTGLALGAVYCWRKSLVGPIVIHATNNLVMSMILVALISLHARSPYLGIRGRLEERGHVVQKVLPRSPAERAGLLPDDVVVRIDGSRVKPGNDVGRILLAKKPDQVLEIELLRGGRPVVMSVRAEQRP